MCSVQGAYNSTTPGSCNLQFSFHRKLRISKAETVSGFEEKIVYATKLSGFKVSTLDSGFKFFEDMTKRGSFYFRISPLLCKLQNQSGTKILRNSSPVRNNFL